MSHEHGRQGTSVMERVREHKNMKKKVGVHNLKFNMGNKI